MQHQGNNNNVKMTMMLCWSWLNIFFFLVKYFGLLPRENFQKFFNNDRQPETYPKCRAFYIKINFSFALIGQSKTVLIYFL